VDLGGRRAVRPRRVDLEDGPRDRSILPLWDIGQFVFDVASFCSSGMAWRGTLIRVDENGMLSPVHEKRRCSVLYGRYAKPQ
jgi:ceramide glucosyltransferase